MSYTYGAPSKPRNANVVYIYGPTFGNAETVSFYLLHNVSTLNQCREVSCVTFVCKHFEYRSVSEWKGVVVISNFDSLEAAPFKSTALGSCLVCLGLNSPLKCT